MSVRTAETEADRFEDLRGVSLCTLQLLLEEKKTVWKMKATSEYEDELKTRTVFLGKDKYGQPPSGERLAYDWVKANFMGSSKYQWYINELYANVDEWFNLPVGNARKRSPSADLHGFPVPGAGIPPLGTLVPSLKYLQGKHNRCVAYAGANALYEFADLEAAEQLAKMTKLMSLQELGAYIHSEIKGWNVVTCKNFYPNADTDRDRSGLMSFMLTSPPEFPVIARIEDSSGNANHCIAIVGKAALHCIYDSNIKSPMPLSQQNLNRCACDTLSQDTYTCIAIVDAIMLKPSSRKQKKLKH